MKDLLSEWVYPSAVALYGWLRNVVALFLCGVSLGWLVGMSTSPVLQTVLAALLAIMATLLTATLGLPKSSEDKKAGLADILSGVFRQAFGGQSVAEKSALSPANTPETVRVKSVSPYNALPLGWFLFCLVGGAAGGIFTRTNELLGTMPSVVAWRLGVNPNDSVRIAKQVLAEQYGLRVAETKTNTTNAKPVSMAPRISAALFSGTKDSVDFCSSVKFLNGPELRDELSQQVAEQLNRGAGQSKRRELKQLQGVLAKEPNERVLQQIRNRLCLQQ